MINISKEEDSPTKKEGNTSDHHGKINTNASSSSSTSWFRLKDPRIVRVSRAFGGKDRHSKVCTIRGLRDRRVRLSVPTAIQLYDLQDRLGLNQPSKVIDWLLNAAKHEIDELPPLPVTPMTFGFNHQASLSSSHEVSDSQSNKEALKMNSRINWEEQGGLSRASFWSSDALLRAKSKEVARASVDEKENWTKGNEENKKESNEEGNSSAQAPSSSASLNLRATHSSSSAAGLINNPMPYASFFQLEHPSFPFAHMGSHGFTNQTDDLHNLNAGPFPSPLSLSSGSQILICPPGAAPQTYFPSHLNAASAEIDPRQVNQFQMLASSTQNPSNSYSVNQSARPFNFSLTPRLFHSLNGGSQPDNKDQ